MSPAVHVTVAYMASSTSAVAILAAVQHVAVQHVALSQVHVIATRKTGGATARIT